MQQAGRRGLGDGLEERGMAGIRDLLWKAIASAIELCRSMSMGA